MQLLTPMPRAVNDRLILDVVQNPPDGILFQPPPRDGYGGRGGAGPMVEDLPQADCVHEGGYMCPCVPMYRAPGCRCEGPYHTCPHRGLGLS